jgi:small RNA 2'-O-methyltransferase
MAILEIQSKNKDISWIIFKNPETQNEKNEPFKKPLRKGYVYGWYTCIDTFKMLFKDGEQSSFYKNLDNKYLDQSAYNCPYVYCGIISEMLRTTIQSKHEKDIICEQTIKLNSIYLTQPRIAQNFIKYFSNKINITLNELCPKIYEITFSGNESLFYLINLVQVFCMLQSIDDKNLLLDLSSSTLMKYAQNLININAPYFIVYIFISRAIKEFDSFKKIKTLFEQYEPSWHLTFGNTQKQRYDVIKNYLKNGTTLHDIGCGELFYSKNLSPKFEKIYAWDADDAIQQRNAKYLEKKNISNIELKHAFSIENFNNYGNNVDILITEMLEHIDFEDAKKALQDLSMISFNKMLITVPNRDFNQFYKLEHQFRHDDHKWEPNFAEINELMHTIFSKEHTLSVIPIGDKVGEISVSTLIYIEKKI